MQMPKNAEQLIRSFQRLDDKRKREIVKMFDELPEGARNYAIDRFVARHTATEGAFVLHLFGKEAPAVGASPENKSLAAPQVK